MRENMKVIEPKTKEDFEQYYDLRWRILREPWDQPRGSEKDDLEKESIHVMVSEDSKVMGIGRVHLNSPEEGQIRYMAIEDGFQGKGVGTIVLKELETKIKERGAKLITLNARETAVNFYKKHGYRVVKKSHTLFGSIPHYKMEKEI